MLLVSDQGFHVFYFQLNYRNFRKKYTIIQDSRKFGCPAKFMIKEVLYLLNHGVYIIPKSITICIFHAKFLKFSDFCVSTINTLHALRTWRNNKHLICIETKMKLFGVLYSLDIENDQIKHLESLRWRINISRVALSGR